jgi:hypothetical protein
LSKSFADAGIPADATTEGGKILTLINNALSTNKIDARGLKDIQKYARDNALTLQGGVPREVLLKLNTIAKKTLNESVPGYSNVNELFGNVRDIKKEFAKKIPIAKLDKNGKPIKDEKIYSDARNIIDKAELPFEAGKTQREQLGRLEKSLTELSQKNPEILEKMGIKNIQQYIDNARKASDIQAVGHTLKATGEFGQQGLIGGTLNFGRKGVATAALGVGKTLYHAKKIGNLGARLTNMSDDGLQSLAQKLSANPSTRHMGEGLMNSIQQTKGASSKNAVLFTILQNPNSRKAVQEMFEGEEEE